MQSILDKIVGNDVLHAKWLNTLSFMENAGARKISACEHMERTGIMQLKHAAEEHRHAFYLKKQLIKLQGQSLPYYEPQSMLGGIASRQYLHKLDILTCRYLKGSFALVGADLRYAAYLFVTYAIEVRADALYPVYQDVLSDHKSKVTVKSIILEEEGHLEEMIKALKEFSPEWEQHSAVICTLEERLFSQWEKALAHEMHADGSRAAAAN